MHNNSADIRSKTMLPDAAAPINGTPTTSASIETTPDTPASSVVLGIVTASTLPPTEQERRPRPPKTKPSFVALDVDLPREADTQLCEDLTLPDHTMRLEYEMVLRGGREEFLRVKSQLVLPLALEFENLAQTDVSFPALVDQVIVRPLVTKFRSFLQKRFDAASATEAKKRSEAEPPQPLAFPANNIKLPKPTNGASHKMSDMPAKLPTARMPGGYGTLT